MTPRVGMAMTIAGVVLVVGGLVGGFVTGGDEDDGAEPTEITGPTETPDPADEEGAPEDAPDETPEAFYALLEAAFQDGDVDFMIERLHASIVELYGEAPCRAFLGDQPTRTIDVVDVGATEPFDFGQREGIDLVIDDTLVVTIRQSIEGADEPVESESHIVRADDGTFRWFTDCGDPA